MIQRVREEIEDMAVTGNVEDSGGDWSTTASVGLGRGTYLDRTIGRT
jgi:hypothetical protein